MKIDKLGYYKTRGGDVVEIVEINTSKCNEFPAFGKETRQQWTAEGSFYPDGVSQVDLIAYLGDTHPDKPVMEEASSNELRLDKTSDVAQMLPSSAKITPWDLFAAIGLFNGLSEPHAASLATRMMQRRAERGM